MADTAVKIYGDDGKSFTVGGYAVCWGGRDLVGDYFTKRTDFWFDRLSPNPVVLYQHGRDETMKRSIVGRITTKKPDDIGLWVEAQISAAKQYADAIRQLVSEGVLGWSTGAVPHLVERKSGPNGTKEITSWPIAEISLTPTPAEPRTVGVRELKALALLAPELQKATSLVDDSYEDLQMDLCDAATAALGQMACVVATYPTHVIVRTMPMGDSDGEYWDFPYTLDDTGEPTLGEPAPVQQAFVPDTDSEGKAKQGMSRSSYAWVDSSGTGHLDISDEGHVRAAMARFNQTHFDSPGAKRSAARRIVARARSMGMDVDPESAVANAAKSAEQPAADDERYWAPHTAAAKMRAVSELMWTASEQQVGDLKALERLGQDTHEGRRLQAVREEDVDAAAAILAEIKLWARAVNTGADEQAARDIKAKRAALLAI